MYCRSLENITVDSSGNMGLHGGIFETLQY